MKPISLIPILLLSLIFFGFDDPCAVDSPQLTHNCRGVRPDAPTGNPSTPNFYYHPWLEYPYKSEMQGPLPPNQGTDDYEILFHTTGPYENSMLGRSLCSAGDQNGDGFDDIIAYCDDPPEVRLYYGGVLMDTIPDFIIPMQSGDGLVLFPTELTDLNGDNDVDLVVEWEEDWHYQEVYVYYGGALLDTIKDLTLVCDEGSMASGEGFGYFMSCGDVNGDEYDDLAIGAPNYTNFGGGGKVFTYFGGSNFDTIPDFTMTSAYNNFGDVFGGHISVSGDVNNDGYNDLISIWSKTYEDSTGVYLFNGSENLDSIPDWKYQLWYAPNQYNVLGTGILQDLNNDNYDDIFVFTAHGAGYETHIFFGADIIGNYPDLTIPCGGHLTSKIRSTGDVNANGYNDMIIGNFEAGWVKVYFGGNIMNNQPDLTFYNEYNGFDVGFAGDVNNDGIHDFMFSVVDFYNPTAGEIFIYSDPSLTPHAEPRNKEESPTSFILDQNFPNPFNCVAVIPFQSNINGDIKLNIYNILGQSVYFAEYFCTYGEYVRVLWDGKDISGNVLPSGLYFAELMAGDYREAIKMEILR